MALMTALNLKEPKAGWSWSQASKAPAATAIDTKAPAANKAGSADADRLKAEFTKRMKATVALAAGMTDKDAKVELATALKAADEERRKADATSDPAKRAAAYEATLAKVDSAAAKAQGKASEPNGTGAKLEAATLRPKLQKQQAETNELEKKRTENKETRAAARTYYESLRTQNLAAIAKIDKELEGIPEHAPNQSSIFGPGVDKKTRQDRRAELEAQKTDFRAGNEVIAGNLILLDDANPENQAKAVSRANASRAVYSKTEPMKAVQTLLTGAGKSTTTTVDEHKTAFGTGTTTESKATDEVNLKEGTFSRGESNSVTKETGGKTDSKTTSSSKRTYGRDGITDAAEEAKISDGKIEKVNVSKSIKVGDGRVGTETTIGAGSGTDDDGNIGKGVTVSGTGSKGVTIANDSVSADAGLKGSVGAQNGAQQTISVTPGVNGKVSLAVVKDADGRYWANLTFHLSVSLSAGGALGHESKEKNTIGATGGVEGRRSDTRTMRFPLTQEEMEPYKADFQVAEGGGSSARPGLSYVTALKNKGDDAVVAMLDGASPTTAAAKGQGYEREKGSGFTGSGGGNAGGAGDLAPKVAVTASYATDRKVKYGFVPKAGDPDTLIVTITVGEDTTKTLGGTAGTSATGAGASLSSKSAGGSGSTFEMANDPTLVKALDNISTEEEAKAFAAAHSKKMLETTKRSGTGSTLGESASVGPMSANMNFTGEHGENVHKDGDGKVTSTEVYGRNNVAGALKAGPLQVASRSDTDELAGTVNRDGTADLNLEKKTTTGEMSADELKKNMKEHPIASSYALLTGSSAPYTKTTTDVTSTTKLSEDDLTQIQKAAESKNDATWTKACWDGKAMKDWFATRQKIRDAKGDKTKIAKALTEFEDSWDSGRSDTIKGLGVGQYDAAWPPKLASERARFEQVASAKLVASCDATFRKDGLEAAQKEIEGHRATIADLQRKISDNVAEFSDQSAVPEMNKVLGKRASELLWLKGDILRRSKETQQQRHDAVTSTQLSHGVDTEKGQSFMPLFDPQQSISEEDLYKTPPCAPEPEKVLTPEEEDKKKTAEAQEAIAPDLITCGTNRKIEGDALRWVESELAKKKAMFSKPDYGAIFAKLNEVKKSWPGWEAAVARMKTAVAKAGKSTAGVEQEGPRKVWWNQLNDEATGDAG